MADSLLAMALAIIFGFAILGYLATLGALRIAFTQARSLLWIMRSFTIALYCFGVGSIFIVPAFVYGRYKAGISDMAFTVFWVSATAVFLLLIVIVKTWIRVLPPSVRRGKTGKEPGFH